MEARCGGGGVKGGLNFFLSKNSIHFGARSLPTLDDDYKRNSITGKPSNRQCNGKPDGTPCKKDCRASDCQMVLIINLLFSSDFLGQSFLFQAKCCAGCCKRGNILKHLKCPAE